MAEAAWDGTTNCWQAHTLARSALCCCLDVALSSHSKRLLSLRELFVGSAPRVTCHGVQSVWQVVSELPVRPAAALWYFPL